jgi:hypothetical protein
MDDAEQLADQVADAITALTGRVWEEPARARLATSLEDSQLHVMAVRWLAGSRPPDPAGIDWTRRLLIRVLSGAQDRPLGIGGVLLRRRGWVLLHRRGWRNKH